MSVFSMAGSNPALPTYPLQRSVRLRSSASAYFSRTPAAAGNRKTWTLSFWFKRGTLGVLQSVFVCGPSTGLTDTNYFGCSFNSTDTFGIGGGATSWRVSNAIYRDPSAWYHVVIAVDTTQATGANRIRAYVNGVELTWATPSDPTLNADLGINQNISHSLGSSQPALTRYVDGYLEEVNFVDGQQLTASSFGAYNSYGVWSPAKYTGSYGTNGFYLNFQDNSAVTTTANIGIGADSSGNGNYWTSNNISLTAGVTYDSMLDVPTNTSPTNANYATLNPINVSGGTTTFSNGNLAVTAGFSTTYAKPLGTIGMSSGKWYWETTIVAVGSAAAVGVGDGSVPSTTTGLGGAAGELSYVSNGQKYTNAVASAYGATYTTNDVIGVAYDADAGSITFYKNNTSQGTITGLSGTKFPGVSATGGTAQQYAVNFGQRSFTYTPPTGFNRLNTYNLPDSIVPVGAQYMAATTYTGTGAARSVANTVNGTSFQPDFVWIKDRSVASAHALTNAVTGITKYLESNTTAAETTDTTSVTALNSTGFSLGAGTATYFTNRNGESFVAWQWKASNASAVTNTSGTGTSTVSANQTAGFSIVTMTGIPVSAGTNTYGHGLGAAPRLIIFKNINIVDSWYVYHASLGNAAYVRLDLSAAQITSAAIWGNTSPTTSVFTLRNNALNTTTGQIILAYCFAEVPGYSKITSYTANGSADGPFVYCGFRPRFILVKDVSSASGNWDILDTSRSPYNLATARLMANQNAAEDTGLSVDVLSNGFKVRVASSDWGVTNGNTVIFAAFSENPFKNALAR